MWGGEPKCDHEWIEKDWYRNGGGRAEGGNFIEAGEANATNIKDSRWMVDSACARCAAWRGEMGLEPTPEMYVAHVVEIFRELKRVLRADGTLWLNLGDSYATGGGRAFSPGGGEQGERYKAMGAQVPDNKNPQSGIPIWQPNRMPLPGLKPKDLIGIPWRVAFALQADGWYLRSDIIWAKPNPMPESVTDRPTRSHEYVFLLSKSERYYYDSEAIREPNSSNEQLEHNLRYAKPYEAYDSRGGPSGTGQPGNENNRGIHSRPGNIGRNRRSVWTVTTNPFPDAHFATFPPDLIKPCILAGTSSTGACGNCGAPYQRVVERSPVLHRPNSDSIRGNSPSARAALGQPQQGSRSVATSTLGWQPTCQCKAEIKPCVVLDPFAGSGTTGKVAIELGRKAILIEPKAEYIEMIKRRCQTTIGLPLAI